MAKSGKHKKIRKQEKAKTQLKGKTLLKAQNVIVPKLQSKKIFLREQLKTLEEGEASTRRNQNIFDILAALNHHNTNIKLESLSGLYELITTENNVLDNHLGRIVEKIAVLTSDSDRAVRKETLRVAETLLCYISEDQLRPFWNLLLTHLKCTLTNLLPSIRQHCLLFITLLIEHCPNLVATSKDIILPAVMNLISTSTTSTTSASGLKTRLKLDISDQSTEIKERIRVLSLIASCLDLETEPVSANLEFTPEPTNTSNSYNRRSITRVFLPSPETGENNVNLGHRNTDHSKPFSSYLEVYYPFGYEDETHRKQVIVSSSLDFNVTSGVGRGDYIGIGGGQQQIEGTNGNSDANSSPVFMDASKGFLYRFIHSCFPVLCETWVEVAPSNKLLKAKKPERNSKGTKKSQDELEENPNESNSNHLNKNAVDVLQCIVNVMVRLIFHKNQSRHGNSSSSQLFAFDSHDEQSQSLGRGKRSDSKDTFMVELRKSFGPDLQKYFFSSLPFSCVHEAQREAIVAINAQLFRVAARLKVMDRQLMDRFEKYVTGMMQNENLQEENVSIVLETTRMLSSKRFGELSTKFIEFALHIGCQRVVYSFLEDNLSLTAGIEETRFIASIDSSIDFGGWSYLIPHFVKDFSHKDMDLHTELVSMLTLLAIRHLVDLRPVLKDNVIHFAEKLKDLTGSNLFQKYQDLVVRLFFYAGSLEQLEGVASLECQKIMLNLKSSDLA